MDPQVVEQPEHPGRQCHDVHPGVPHRAVTDGPAPRNPGFPPAPVPLRVGAPDARMDPAPDWTRWEEWASRALEYSGQAIDVASKQQPDAVTGETKWSPHVAALENAARLCADIAASASPAGVMPMPRIDIGGGVPG